MVLSAVHVIFEGSGTPPADFTAFEPTVNVVDVLDKAVTNGRHALSGTCVMTYFTLSLAAVTVPGDTVSVPPPRPVVTVPAVFVSEVRFEKKPPELSFVLETLAYWPEYELLTFPMSKLKSLLNWFA